jgi:translation initiation factor IF-2
LSNSNRDSQGRWSSANIAAHTPSNAANAGGGPISSATDPAPASKPLAGSPNTPSGGPQPGTDHWAGAADQTATLLNRPSGGGVKAGGGARAQAPQPRNYAAGFTALGLRAGGYGGNESAGQHQVQAPGGRAGHGADVPGSGMPGPGDGTDLGGAPGAGGGVPAGGAAGGAEAAGAAAGLEELAPLALGL